MAIKMTSPPRSTSQWRTGDHASDAVKGEKAKEEAHLQPWLEFQLKTTKCDLCYPHCHVFYLSHQNTRGGQGVKDWRKFQKASLNSTTGIAQSHFHFTTRKAYGHWVIIEGADNQEQRNTVGQWGRLHISIWSRLCWGRVTRQPRKDVKNEGKKNHADRAQDQGPPQCRHQTTSMTWTDACRTINQVTDMKAASHQRRISLLQMLKRQDQGKLAKTVVPGSLPATKSEQETGTKYFKWWSSAPVELPTLSVQHGCIIFLPKYNLFLVMTKALKKH